MDYEDFDEYWLRTNRTADAAIVTGVVILSTSMASILSLMSLVHSPEVIFSTVGLIAAVVAVGTFVCVRRRLTKRSLAASKLMQAIAKDDSVQRELYPASA